MPRAPRILKAGGLYHVINRGVDRHTTFQTDHDVFAFFSRLGQCVERFGVRVHGYALMPNHFHVLLGTPEPNLDAAMKHLGSSYTLDFNRVRDRDGPLFRGRYKAILVEEPTYRCEVIRYIHQNPVKAGLVRHPQDYAWSSHGAYIGTRAAPVWLTTGTLLDEVAGGVADKQKAFHSFVLGDPPAFMEACGESDSSMVVLGRPDCGTPRPGVTYIDDRTLGSSQVLRAVRQVYGVDLPGLRTQRRGLGSEPREAAVLLWLERTAISPQEIASRLGLSMAGVWACRRRFRKKLSSAQEVRARWRRLVAIAETG